MSAPETDTSEILRRLHALPPEALFTAIEAGVSLNARPDLLRAWRWHGRGPAAIGQGHFVRYRKSELDRFLAGYGRGEAA